jgi:glycyl-tRNA synthetase
LQVFPLLQKAELNAPASALSSAMVALGLSCLIDTTGNTIGKRYARTDEIGVPYAVTVDYQTVEDQSVTLRERDSMTQVRVPSGEVPQVVRQLVDGAMTWAQVAAKYPAQKAADE